MKFKYKLSKTEENKILREQYVQEIFDSKPFLNDFSFIEYDNGYYCLFKDLKNNNVKVYFYEDIDNEFEIDFTINGNSFENPNIEYSVRDYSSLLVTISKCIKQFITKFNPNLLKIEGADSGFKIKNNEKNINQKQRIYDYFSSSIDNTEYSIEKNKKFMLIKKIK